MHKSLLLALSAAAALCALTAGAQTGTDDMGGLNDTDDPKSTLLVDDDGAQCPGAQFTTIQAAVLAANSGDKIKICPGTYAEQVRIDKNVRLEGVAVGNENLALLMPGAVVPNSTNLVTGVPFAAIILVDGADKVDLKNLTVDGTDNGLNNCNTNFAGIYYRDGSGKIESVAVRNIRLAAGGETCQTGLAIFVQSSASGKATVEVKESSLHDYQKNGITANEENTEVDVSGNAITGAGPIFSNTQNGIQYGFGAEGKAENNAIANHINAGCTDQGCSTISTSVFIFEAGDVEIKKNTLARSQTGVYVQSDDADVKENTILDSDVFNAVAVIGDDNKIDHNTMFNSDGGAVFVIGDDNKVEHNMINEAPAGIAEASGGSGNRYHGNRFFNTPEQFVVIGSPSPENARDRARSIGAVQAVR